MEYLYPILGKSDVEDFTEVGEEMSEYIGSDLPLPLPSHRVHWMLPTLQFLHFSWG